MAASQGSPCCPCGRRRPAGQPSRPRRPCLVISSVSESPGRASVQEVSDASRRWKPGTSLAFL